MQQDEHHHPGQEVRDPERCDRAEGVNVVDLGQSKPTVERILRTEMVDERRGHGEPEECEPSRRGQDQPDRKQRKRDEDRDTDAVRNEEVTPARTDPGGNRASADVPERDEHGADAARIDQLSPAIELGESRVHDRDRKPERKRRPESSSVQVQGLRDELADRPRLRRKGRGALLPRPALEHQAAAGWAACAFSKLSSPSLASTRTVSPSANSPSSRRSASGFSSRRWIARFSGRAP